MEQIDLSDGFDVHDYREGMKLLKQDRSSTYLANREGLGCPACGRPFEKLFVSTDREVTFDSAPGGPICLARTEEKFLVMTH